MSPTKTQFTELLINERAYVQYMNFNRYVRIDAAVQGPYKRPSSPNYMIGAVLCLFFATYILMAVK